MLRGQCMRRCRCISSAIENEDITKRTWWAATGEAFALALPTDFGGAIETASCEERWEAVRGAFAMREGGWVDNLRILLLDDLMTTGATLDACSRALSEAGAKSVLGLTIARAGRPQSSFVEHP